MNGESMARDREQVERTGAPLLPSVLSYPAWSLLRSHWMAPAAGPELVHGRLPNPFLDQLPMFFVNLLRPRNHNDGGHTQEESMLNDANCILQLFRCPIHIRNRLLKV